MPTPHRQLILCTCPGDETAASIARALLEAKLAACVNIIPGLQSVYRWQDAIETDKECLLVIKTRADLLPALEKIIHDLHPYEVPEILALDAAGGSSGYLAWWDHALAPDAASGPESP